MDLRKHLILANVITVFMIADVFGFQFFTCKAVKSVLNEISIEKKE
ncbi:hypothetical protein [Acidaminobacter sp. JC074]|nr:hypothetical protein [Acidaminobacter sp. JC074]